MLFSNGPSSTGETKQYITNLYSLVEICEYGALKEMLHDRIVVRIKDKVQFPPPPLPKADGFQPYVEKTKMQALQKEAVHNIGESSRETARR